MEEYRNKVIRLHAIYSMIISKSTSKFTINLLSWLYFPPSRGVPWALGSRDDTDWCMASWAALVSCGCHGNHPFGCHGNHPHCRMAAVDPGCPKAHGTPCWGGRYTLERLRWGVGVSLLFPSMSSQDGPHSWDSIMNHSSRPISGKNR